MSFEIISACFNPNVFLIKPSCFICFFNKTDDPNNTDVNQTQLLAFGSSHALICFGENIESIQDF